MSQQLPYGAYRHDISAQYSLHTLPRTWRSGTQLPSRNWATLNLVRGEAELVNLTTPGTQRLRAGQVAVLAPGQKFRINPMGDGLVCHFEYYHESKATDQTTLGNGLRTA